MALPPRMAFKRGLRSAAADVTAIDRTPTPSATNESETSKPAKGIQLRRRPEPIVPPPARVRSDCPKGIDGRRCGINRQRGRYEPLVNCLSLAFAVAVHSVFAPDSIAHGAYRLPAQPTFRRLVPSLAALLAGVGMAPLPPAFAQNLRPALTEDAQPLPPSRPRANRAARQPPQVVEEPQPAPRLRRRSADEPSSDEQGSPEVEPTSGEAPSGVRPAIRDGEPDTGAEPEPVIDGVADEPEEYRNPDGQDGTQWDARLANDSDAFHKPPAGHDPAAFGVELTPLEDRRPSALYRFEPWQPRGIVIGSFTLFPQADIGAAWVSNLFRLRPARPDQALELRPTLRAVSNWRTHALEVRASAGLSFFDEHPREDDRAYALEMRGRIDVTRRTSVSASVRREVVQETRGTLESRLRGAARADVTTDEARLQLDHRFNRFGVQLRGSMLSRDYEDTASSVAGASSNRDRNLRATEEALRLSWAFKPTLQAFMETALNQRRFEAASAADRIKRDSDGERYRVGIGFGNTGQVLRGEVSIGYGRQTPLDMRLASIDGMVVDANLAWRMSAFTAVLLRGSTDVIETSVAGSSGGLTRRVQAEVRHAFLRPLIGTASAGFSSTGYQGIVINENLTELALGLEYYLGPEAVIYGRYQHSTLRTNAASGGWDADEVRIGLRLRR